MSTPQTVTAETSVQKSIQNVTSTSGDAGAISGGATSDKHDKQIQAGSATVSNVPPADGSSNSSKSDIQTLGASNAETPNGTQTTTGTGAVNLAEVTLPGGGGGTPNKTTSVGRLAAPVDADHSPNVPSVVADADKPVITITTPVESTQAARETAQPRVLAIQPTITMSRSAALADDLAGSVPSMPMPARSPLPPKTNGLLNHLTAELASTIVPQFLAYSLVPVAVVEVLRGVLATTLVLLTVFTFLYGLWLRRGGFVTAARSDALAGHDRFFVATSQLLGTGLLPSQYRSPIFCGGRNEMTNQVPNAFRKEEMS